MSIEEIKISLLAHDFLLLGIVKAISNFLFFILGHTHALTEKLIQLIDPDPS